MYSIIMMETKKKKKRRNVSKREIDLRITSSVLTRHIFPIIFIQLFLVPALRMEIYIHVITLIYVL